MKFIVAIALFFISENSYSQALSTEEKKLYDILMQYRKEKGLPTIPLSPSLTTVAQAHVKDLVNNKPDNANCNAHSWSAKGKWTPCCYTPNHAESKCMWSKPKELTKYTGNGYEIACGSNVCCADFVMSAEYALKSWKASKGHNSVIINEGMWKTDKWNAIGIGIYKSFAVVWFGKETDNQ